MKGVCIDEYKDLLKYFHNFLKTLIRFCFVRPVPLGPSDAAAGASRARAHRAGVVDPDARGGAGARRACRLAGSARRVGCLPATRAEAAWRRCGESSTVDSTYTYTFLL